MDRNEIEKGNEKNPGTFPVSGNYFKLQQINFDQLLTPNILDLVNAWIQTGASWLYLQAHCWILVLLLDQTAVMHAEGSDSNKQKSPSADEGIIAKLIP